MGILNFLKKKTTIKFNVETKTKFKQDKDYVLNYLKERGVMDKDYLYFISNNDYSFLSDNTITVFNNEFDQNENYTIEYFLAASDNQGRDIIHANKNLSLDKGDIISIASVAGDDVICMNIKSNEILLYLVQTGDMQFIHVADNFKEFCKKIKFN